MRTTLKCLIAASALSGALAAPAAAADLTVTVNAVRVNNQAVFACHAHSTQPTFDMAFSCGGVPGESVGQAAVAAGTTIVPRTGPYSICWSLSYTNALTGVRTSRTGCNTFTI